LYIFIPTKIRTMEAKAGKRAKSLNSVSLDKPIAYNNLIFQDVAQMSYLTSKVAMFFLAIAANV
jgi:hypothetical protein